MNTELNLIGESSAIKKLSKEIPKLARLNYYIFLRGEPGTGKSLVARLIHKASNPKGALLTINPQTSTEAEMEEIFQEVNSNISTISFNEIEEFSFLHQTRIDNFLGKLPKKPPVRIIVTAKKNFNELAKEGRLIRSLAEKLEHFEAVSIPSLNQMREDIPLLVEYFIRNACKQIGVRLKSIDINALDFLVRREWTENVRELKFVIEKAVITSQDEVIELPETLVDEYNQLEGILGKIDEKRRFSFDKALSNLEKTLIERALEVAGHSQTRAAEILNISEANLRYRLKKFHILTSRQKL